MKKTLQRQMAEIMTGLGILGIGLWYFIPYIVVLFSEQNFEANILKKIDQLYFNVHPFVKIKFASQLEKWNRDWKNFLEKNINPKEEEYKELPMLTYTKQQKRKIDTSKLAGYVKFYRRLKLFYLLFYLPLLISTLSVSFLLSWIKRLEIVESMLSCSENLTKVGYVGLFIGIGMLYVVYGCCFEVFISFLPLKFHFLTFALIDCILCWSLYLIVANLPYTQQPVPGR